MTTVLNNLFHKDNSLALFNGAHNFFNKEVISLSKQKGFKNKTVIYYKKWVSCL